LLISAVNIITIGTATSFDPGGHPQAIQLLKNVKETDLLAGIILLISTISYSISKDFLYFLWFSGWWCVEIV